MQVGQYAALFFDGEGDRLDEWIVGRCTSVKNGVASYSKVKVFYRDTLDNKNDAEDLAEILNQEFVESQLELSL